MGPSDEQTVRYLLEVLRLLIRASTWSSNGLLLEEDDNKNLLESVGSGMVEEGPSIKEITEFASFVSQRLDTLGMRNPQALEDMTKKYSNLISVSRLFQETGGSILPCDNERYDKKKSTEKRKTSLSTESSS